MQAVAGFLQRLFSLLVGFLGAWYLVGALGAAMMESGDGSPVPFPMTFMLLGIALVFVAWLSWPRSKRLSPAPRHGEG